MGYIDVRYSQLLIELEFLNCTQREANTETETTETDTESLKIGFLHSRKYIVTFGVVYI